jgi:membrane fusion protein (multidrug efflux system)
MTRIQNMRNRPVVSFIILCLVVVLAWYAFSKLFGGDEGQQKMPPTLVETTVAKQQAWQKNILANGTLTASEGIALAPEVPGRVTKIYFESGEYVKQGTPVVQLYPDIIKAQLAKAHAQLNVDKNNFERYNKLYQRGYYDKLDLDKAAALVESDQADVDYYNAQLDQLLIKAPFDGLLGIRQISLGDYLNAGTLITNLNAIDPIRADFSVPDIYVNQIRVGDKITIASRALDATYDGTVMALNSKVNEDTRTLDVRAKIPNANHKLTPGTYVQVTVYLGNSINPIILPQDAIVYDLSGPYVYKVVDQRAVKTDIKLGEKTDNNEVMVLDGLTAGDVVVTAGQLKLFDNAPVMVSQPPPLAVKK